MKEYHRVCPKWFLSLWYVRSKPSTYLTLRLTLSPNGLIRASTWRTSHVPSGGSKMISEPNVHSVQTVHLSCTEINTISKQTETSSTDPHITKEYHRVCPKWFLSLWYVRRKPSTNLTLRLTLSPNGLIWASTWRTSHVPSGGSKMISEPNVHSVQTVHLFYADINTISKQTETSST
jgi:hypothetical protein